MTSLKRMGLSWKQRQPISEACLVLPLDPVPASRPRVTRWGAYYGKRYTEFRKRGNEILANLSTLVLSPSNADLFPLYGVLEVTAIFNVVKPRTSKLSIPRGDVDNYFKTLDICNGIVWGDDQQIKVLHAIKRFNDVGSIELRIKEIKDGDNLSLPQA